jgi:hypothetical protein
MSTMDANKRAVNIDIKIKSVTVKNVKDRMEVIAIWHRGNKHIDTQKAGKISSNKTNTRFGDQF